ncbi:MAG: PspC domain-containing protein [Bacteroidales bacterium]|jgi:phage shock protein PspC (stress-responsive transcriptional regulator)|nr:PspC domain-containing protein [Bacteroidales bacterium]MBQ7532691.1 PspC domain-containing protein [Bacteroidales bacterium]MCR5037131.1 PspC domain-containing protein [Bacteroidales bacterium]
MEGNKVLYRSRRNRVIAGVCAGLADYFNIDISLMRVLFFVALLCGSFGFWMYVILWIVVPEENIIGPGTNDQYRSQNTNYGETIDITPNEEGEPNNEKKSVSGAMIASLILIFIGLVALIDNFTSLAWVWKLWPVPLIMIGVIILMNSLKNNNNEQ